MDQEPLHPSVAQFKSFVKKHPLLIKEVREGKKSWNQLYQDWVILGEEDETWLPYKKTDNKGNPSSNHSTSGELLPAIIQSLSQLNIQDLQKHLSQFSGITGNIQQLLNQFQPQNQQRTPQRGPENPFSFRGF